VRKRSWPAVSQSWHLTREPSSSIDRLVKSTPIVETNSSLKDPFAKRTIRQDLPTPESPMRMHLKFGLDCAGMALPADAARQGPWLCAVWLTAAASKLLGPRAGAAPSRHWPASGWHGNAEYVIVQHACSR
jgi:hypothetical protein